MGHGIDYRPYQVEARDAAFETFSAGTESALIVMPTGTGKTVLGGMCVEEAIQHERKTLFLAHREILIQQAATTLSLFGHSVAIEMGVQSSIEHEATMGEVEVVVGSVQSFQDDRLMRHDPNEFGLIIVDECHRSLSDSYSKIFNWFRNYWLIGITATPERGDGRNLGARFEKPAFTYRLRTAIKQGWLVPIHTRQIPAPIDLRGIKVSGSDLPLGEIEDRIAPHIEALARSFIREVGSKPFVFFTPDVGSAKAFAETCSALGIETRYVAGTGGKFGMPKPERKAILAQLDAGEIQGVACCEILVEGWDCPKIEAVGIGRPTLQRYRYTQMVGRGTRPSPATGKTECLVIDYDWETDPEVKNLCSTIDLFDDGSINEEAFPIARQLAKQAAVDTDPMELLDEADKIIRSKQRLMIKLTGKEWKYEALEYDPVGVSKILDIKLNRRYDLNKKGDNPATDRQLEMLRANGLTAPEGLSKWGASKMIGKILKRREQGLAEAHQVRSLLSGGVDPDRARGMSAADAAAAIIDLSRIAKLNQGTLFQ